MVPKYRFRILKELIKEHLEKDLRMLCEWKKSEMMGMFKGKTAIKIFRSYPELKKKPYRGNHFWVKGYFVNTIGLNEGMIRR